MKKANCILVLAAAGLLLGACNEDHSSDSSDSREEPSSSISGSDSSSSSSSSSSSDQKTDSWSEEDKALMKEYCGGVLPYPAGFVGAASVRVIEDEKTETKYLEITNRSRDNVIDDYYLDLEKDSWKGARDYSGNIKKTDSKGTPYYELVKTDENKGYNLIYFVDTSMVAHYNVIQCYNDFANKLVEKDWNEQEKKVLDSTVTIVPPKVKLGEINVVSAYGMDATRCYDQCAVDATETNASILKANGWSLDEEESKESGVYVLYKTVNEEEKIEAYLFYNSGNFVVFNYIYTLRESATWPSEATAAFKEKTGFEIPAFNNDSGSIEKYCYYTKNNVVTIMAQGEWYVDSYFVKDLTNKDLVFYRESLLSRELYTDWEETFFVSPFYVRDQAYNDIFCVSFGELDEKIHSFTTGWPSEMVDNFLNKNNISVACPSIDYSKLGSPKSTTRYEVANYEDVYPTWLKAVQENPSSYGIEDGTDTKAIEEKAKEKAKENSYIKISIRDPEIRIDETYTEYKVDQYLEEYMKSLGWSRTNGDIGDTHYDIAYEDPTGEFLFATDLESGKEGICTVTITYGSGKTHTPVFKFEEKQISVSSGDTAKLRLTVDMLPYKVTYESDNSLVTVDENGNVTVSDEATTNTTATITASLTDPNGKTYSDTCVITITEHYDIEKAINAVAKAYNKHFNFDADSDSAAKPEKVTVSNVDEGTVYSYYTFNVNPSSVTEDELKALVVSTLVPPGFTHEGEITWNDGEFADGIENKWLGYVWENQYGDGVDLMFYVYTDSSGNLALRVMASPAE